MNALVQYIVVAIVIAIALVVTINKISTTIRNSDTDPHCAGCPLAAQCGKTGIKQTAIKNSNQLENCKKCRDKVAQSRN